MIYIVSAECKKLPEEYDKALVGSSYNSQGLVYSVERCLEVLMENQGMDMADAQEYFTFNIGGAGGEGFPTYIYTDDLDTLLQLYGNAEPGC